jgi:hypothetical protein
VNSVTDMFTGGSNIDVDCPSGAPTTGPWTIAAGGSLVCSYSGDSDGTTPGTNTATATQQNYARAADGTATASGTTDYTGTAGFTMNDPDIEVYACVDVYDLFSVGLDEATLTLLDTVLLEQDGAQEGDASLCNEDAPVSFSFSYTPDMPWFSADPPASEEDPPLCELLVDNTADVYPYDTMDPLLATDSVRTVIQNADCVFGCTLTQGYWKTHSAYGPAPYDDNWTKVGDMTEGSPWVVLGLEDSCDSGQCGEDTPFFGSGQSWYEVLWTPPKGNAYYILAHQFIATTLNVLNEADPSEIADDWGAAKALFEACDPADISKRGGGSCSARGFKTLASILDDYNNGLIGPGHCSEDDTSAE